MNHATASRPLLVLAALALLAGCNQEVPIPKDPPEARKDYARTPLDTPVTLEPLANDHDADDPVLTITAIGAAAHGTAVLNPDQSVTYTPSTGYLGPDSFTVTVRDGHNNEVTESAYITVGDSVRFIYMSNYVDFWTKQLYLSDSAHPGVAIPVSGWLPVTRGPYLPGTGITDSSFYFMQTDDGEAVVYIADDEDSRFAADLFYVDLDRPGVPVKLTDFPSGTIPFFAQAPKVSPDHQYVYYMSNEFTPDVYEIVRVEVANPANKVRMNPPLVKVTLPTTPDPTERWEEIPRFDLSPDGTRLLYVKQDPDLMGPTITGRELYVIDVATPGVATKINGTPTTGTGGLINSSGIHFQPLGASQVVYPSTEGGSTTIDLWLVDYVALTAPVKLSGTGVNTSGGVTSFRISPDQTRVVFEANHAHQEKTDIFTAEVANPGVETQLSNRRAGGTLPVNYLISYDSSYVVYVSDESTEDLSELYFVDFANPTVRVKLNHTLSGGTTPLTAENVQTWFQLSPGAPRQVLYATNQPPVDNKIDQKMRLVSVDAPATNVSVGSGFAVGYVFTWHPDADTVITFDDPDRKQVVSAYEMKVSDAAHKVKLTLEQYPKASVGINYTYPFLP